MLKTIFLSVLAALSFAQNFQIPSIEYNPEKYVCFRSKDSLNIDGILDELSWSKAVWSKDFLDIEGSPQPVPRFRTRVKMLWDKNYFYVAAELMEPHIWGMLKNRDDIIYNDNDFEVFIDPDGDTHNYAELEINALNTIWDLFLIQPYRDIQKAAVHNWEIKGLKTAVHIYGTLNNPSDKDSCWTIELAFPWKVFEEITSVSVPPKDGDQWRVNFSRVEWNTVLIDGTYRKEINPETNKPLPENNWVWSPQGLINIHYPELWGYIQFSAKEADSSGVTFLERREEQAKWLLRNIYYAEKNYFLENNTYTSDLLKLHLNSERLTDFSSPVIESTSNQFEASLELSDGYRISIDQSGLVSTSRSRR